MLQIARLGSATGCPHIVLHDRYGGIEDARRLGTVLAPPDAAIIAVQAPRLQTVGGVGQVKGYYWYVGPRHRAELTSLGDSLFHLEQLLLEATQILGTAVLIGHGEGGTMALLTAMTWPEKIAHILAIDAALPLNFAKIPVDWPPLGNLRITLVGQASNETIDLLLARGADVRLVDSVDAIARSAAPAQVL
jgi:pimeloyl-ACP methyl ester carboxylesterase